MGCVLEMRRGLHESLLWRPISCTPASLEAVGARGYRKHGQLNPEAVDFLPAQVAKAKSDGNWEPFSDVDDAFEQIMTSASTNASESEQNRRQMYVETLIDA